MKEDELMLTAVLGCRRVDLFTAKPFLSADQEARYRRMRARRAQGQALQYVIGETSFMGMPLVVDERVLIPRPETEILVEQALAHIGGQGLERPRVLDLGTGSGNIAIAMAKHIAGASVTAVDVSPDALNVARRNAALNGVTGQIEFVCEDMGDFLKTFEARKFDIVLSNPPYIPEDQLSGLPADVRREPSLALNGGADGVRFYRVILRDVSRVLNPGAFLFMEIGDGQREAMEDIFRQYPDYQFPNFYKDYAGTDRIVMSRFRRPKRI